MKHHQVDHYQVYTNNAPGAKTGPLRVHISLYDWCDHTSKPPLDIFSYILAYIKHTWLQFTLDMETSIKQEPCQNFIFIS